MSLHKPESRCQWKILPLHRGSRTQPVLGGVVSTCCPGLGRGLDTGAVDPILECAKNDVHLVRSIAERAPAKLRSVAQGLDDNAVKAAKLYRFSPATYQGKPVPFATKVEISFRIY
jgi:hypothetical protein